MTWGTRATVGRAALGALAVLLAPTADAGEWRRIVITPDLVLEGEVLETKSGGFRVRVAQGTLFVPFDLVQDLTELDVAPPPTAWSVVLVASDAARAPLAAGYGALPSTTAATVADLPPADQLAARSCGDNLGCLSVTRPTSAWTFFVTARLEGDRLLLAGAPPFLGGAVEAEAPISDASAVWRAMHEVLGVEPSDPSEAAPDPLTAALAAMPRPRRPEPAPTPAPTTPPAVPGPPAPTRDEDDRWTAQRVTAWSFVPVPGLPSAMRGQWGSFAGALLTTAATTTGWVVASGAVTTRQGEHAALATAGAYASSVLCSGLFGQLAPRDRTVAVGLVPRVFDGRPDGWTVGVVVAPR